MARISDLADLESTWPSTADELDTRCSLGTSRSFRAGAVGAGPAHHVGGSGIGMLYGVVWGVIAALVATIVGR